MSSGRGGRGAERSARGPRGRGGSFRGKHADTSSSGDESTKTRNPFTQPWQRGQSSSNRGFDRGGRARGGTGTRGDNNAVRGNWRGRGKETNSTSFSSRNSSAPPDTSGYNSTPYANESYGERFDWLKQQRSVLRQRFIQEKKMNPEGQMRLSDAVKLVGICEEMCPEYERVQRIHQNDVQVSEYTPETVHGDRSAREVDEARMVKKHKRSAAGDEVELVSEIRSPAACLKSMNYLANLLDDDDGLPFHQPFVWDRSRAVRKDLNTQAIDEPRDIALYLECHEQCVRIHLLCYHVMSHAPQYPKYDVKMELEQLTNTLISLKQRYDDNRRARVPIPSHNEAEFQAVRLIMALRNMDKNMEFELSRLGQLQNNGRIQTALMMYRAGRTILSPSHRPRTYAAVQQNWKNWWDLIRSSKVSYLMGCAAEFVFDKIREVILDTLCRCYKQLKITVDSWTIPKVAEVLSLDSDVQAKAFCESLGYTFGCNEQGIYYLDITGPQGDPIPLQMELTSNIVEAKRGDRLYSAVIQGMRIEDARSRNLIQGGHGLRYGVVPDSEMGEDSLFIPENAPGLTFDNSAKAIPAVTATNPFAASQASPSPFSAAAQGGSSLFQGGPSTTMQHGLFNPSKNSITFATPPSSTNSGNPFGNAATTAPTNHFAPGAAAPIASNPFGAPKSTLNAAAPSFAFGQPSQPAPAVSSTQSEQPPAAFSLPKPDQQLPAVSQEEEQRKAQVQQQKALEDKKRAEEVQQRLQEEKERQAREAVKQEQERRKKEAEEQERVRQAREAQERENLQRTQEEQQRRILEEQQRRAREEEERRALEAEARRAQEAERELAITTLTEQVFLEPDRGLCTQWIENELARLVPAMAQEAYEELRQEQNEQLADQMYRQKRQAFERAVGLTFIAKINKKKRARGRREKRRWRREEAPRLWAEAQAGSREIEKSAPVNNKPSITDQPNGNPPGFRKPEAPASAQRAQKPPAPRAKANMENTHENATPHQLSDKLDRKALLQGSYQMVHKDPKAPVDQTQTDYFKLRAAGLDPLKHRKRSFGSGSEQEELHEESKRLRTSRSSTPRSSWPVPTTGEDRLARFRAMKEALSQPIGSTGSIGTMRHDFGRSVPNLLSSSILSQSTLGNNTGSSGSNENRPAYWGRVSRFVPRHLYGKGPEAIAEYRRSINGTSAANSPANSAPLELSSPIPTQQSYIPQSISHQEVPSVNWSGTVVHGHVNSSNLNVTGDADADDEYNQISEEEELYDYEEGEEEEEEEEEDEEDEEDESEQEYDDYDLEMSDEDDDPQNAQLQPGGTQDDAIELSD